MQNRMKAYLDRLRAGALRADLDPLASSELSLDLP
jgi:hypothetical protein